MRTEKRAAQAVWGASPAGTTHAGGAEPGTREFFERVLALRNSYEIPWLGDLVPFASYRGRSVLEVGCGAGFDAYSFAIAGADYTGVDITPENPVRTRTHLGFYGLQAKLAVADGESLPFDTARFDLVFSNGVLMCTPDMDAAFREAFRVVRTGGEFCVILYHKNSIFYRISLVLVNHVLKLGFLRTSLAERLARVEFTSSEELPLVQVYSRKEVRTKLEEAGFEVRGVWVRKLLREDLPFTQKLASLWKRVPDSWLDYVGERFGWYVMAQGVKR